jgi:hypothetical protein
VLDDVLHRSGEPSGSIHRDEDQTCVALRGIGNAVVHIFGHHRLNFIADAQLDDLRGGFGSIGKKLQSEGVAQAPQAAGKDPFVRHSERSEESLFSFCSVIRIEEGFFAPLGMTASLLFSAARSACVDWILQV